MNNYKVGQRVKVITASTGTELNVSGWVGEIMEVQSDNFVGIKFAEYPLLYCFSDDGISLNVEILEPTPPTPKWIPIDRDNLPVERVAAMHINTPLVFTGTLYLCDNKGISLEICAGATVHGFTHYIVLQDLLNLPISE